MQWWSLSFRLTCSVVLWGGRNTANKYHRRVFTVIQPHWVCPCSRCVCFPSLHCSDSRLLCWEPSDVSHFSGLSCSGSGSRVLHKGTDLVGPAFCAHPRSEWRRQWHPTPVLLPGKSRGWRSLVGYSSWGRTESDTTEVI